MVSKMNMLSIFPFSMMKKGQWDTTSPQFFSQFFAFKTREESTHSLMHRRMRKERENQTCLCQFDAELYLRFFASLDANGEGLKPRRPIQIKYYV